MMATDDYKDTLQKKLGTKMKLTGIRIILVAMALMRMTKVRQSNAHIQTSHKYCNCGKKKWINKIL
jgi:hypothetical protein